MPDFRDLFCSDLNRRALLLEGFNPNGIDYIEVPVDDQTHIQVHFLKPLIPGIQEHEHLFRIEGGVRTRNIHVEKVNRIGDTHLEVVVDQEGDFSTYVLAIDHPSLDAPYSRCEFRFKAGCPSRFDCQPRLECPPPSLAGPLIDYMAKDYASFRQALIDLIPTMIPDWTDRHEADLGMALVELLAYVGDHLSYYQDAAANEAYLESARRRTSVRRHARLIDYRMHDGVSARAFVHVEVEEGTGSLDIPENTVVLTGIQEPLGMRMPPHETLIPESLRDEALDRAGAVFETLFSILAHEELNEIPIHTWHNRECCLPPGTTSVDLARNVAGKLAPGDYLLLEEIKSPETGLEADADPNHRQIVLVTEVLPKKPEEVITDPVLRNAGDPSTPVTRVRWAEADALRFPLCVAATIQSGGNARFETRVSVARGNLTLADHGRATSDEPPHKVPRLAAHPTLRTAQQIRLRKGPLGFRIPFPEETALRPPVAALQDTDVRKAQAKVALRVPNAVGELEAWNPVPDLLDSHAFDPHFVVETDNQGRPVLRAGDNEFGRRWPEGVEVKATYRVGVGPEGMVGAEALCHVINPSGGLLDGIGRVRNPLSAWGGIGPEKIERVKRLAPAAFRAEQIRAVTEEDYARAAEKHGEVNKAVATFRWTGSWHTVFVTVDRQGGRPVDSAFEKGLRDFLQRARLAGYDMEIDGPIFVPLEIEVAICVNPGHFRADVERSVFTELSSNVLPDGRLGFFHADNFTFGQPVYLSRLYAALDKVEGVDSAEVRIFKRFTRVPEGELERGLIPIGRLEIARLDNDPNFPENGALRVEMLGGK